MAVPWKTNFGNTATINSGPSGDKSELGLGSYMFADATDILKNVFEILDEFYFRWLKI